MPWPRASTPKCRRRPRAIRTTTRRRAATATRRTAGAGCARARTRDDARSRASATTISRGCSSASDRSARSRMIALLGAGRLVSFGEMEEHSLEIAPAVSRRNFFGRTVGDDPTVRQEHDALTHLNDVAHVVTGHQQRGAVAVAEVEKAAAHALRDIRVEGGRRL